jgi:hypothetical protein
MLTITTRPVILICHYETGTEGVQHYDLLKPAQCGILANWFLVINFTQPTNVQKARKNGSNAKIANMGKGVENYSRCYCAF